ncbi:MULTISPECIES: ComEC/Rec2 family competence protein [Sphingopyxis]|uniref:ComEC/Rec2 family competence protein n=1 Tax=Sphingopyxis TaxID=165697 RepID=UPI00131A3FFF|nr:MULTISPECIES: metallohydrolase [Sphingopyxis]QUM73186.1 metallohydrolase [Sphingopyxis granuli]
MFKARAASRRLLGWILAGAVIGAHSSAFAFEPAVEGRGSPVAREILPSWHEGLLDIHHINTGRGNAAFFVLPDGTSILFDAGDIEDDFEEKYAPLKLGPAVPDRSLRPGQWIADYIRQFAPKSMTAIDYVFVSHFHTDHYGTVLPESPVSAHGPWKLTGIMDVAEVWPIKILIDRGNPDYSFPRPLREQQDESLLNYLRFIDAGVRSGRLKTQGFAVGHDDQVLLRHDRKRYPTFSIRNIAANGEIWTGIGMEKQSTLRADEIVDRNGKFNENPLSLVLKINYGDFDYVTGGDITGVSEPDQPAWFNMESKIAPVVGEVDVMTMNHHGNRDATNADWLRNLKPQVLVEQTWTSDQPGGEVVARVTSKHLWQGQRHIFATHIQEATKVAIGPWLTRNYQSMKGHVLIRVQPGGSVFDVYILDDHSRERPIKSHFGPFVSRPE